MPFEREWLYLDELLALLGPSPDMDHVEATFRGALDEDAGLLPEVGTSASNAAMC